MFTDPARHFWLVAGRDRQHLETVVASQRLRAGARSGHLQAHLQNRRIGRENPGTLSQPRILLELPRRRSLGSVDHEGATYSCFLVTHRDREGRWHGHFSFRPTDGHSEADEVQTANIFLEHSEAEIDHKARGLGRPLLRNLLASALHTVKKDLPESSQLRRRFRALLAENSLELVGEVGGEQGEESMEELRSLYDSYRLDQVCHFIALVDPDRFDEVVDHILDGQAVDFSTKDRLQFSMMVVEFIESRLPLPDFEIWAEDYLTHPQAYHLYAHTLHREGRLP
jgi:hypothetical protein